MSMQYELKVRRNKGGLTLIKMETLFYPNIIKFLVESCGLPDSTAMNFCLQLNNYKNFDGVDIIRMRTDAIGGAVITLTRPLVAVDYVDN